MQLTDLLPLEEWVKLEKEIHRRSGLDANVFDTNGIRITDYKKWVNDLCPVIKANEKGQTFICASAHQNIAAIAEKTREPVIEECDAGMVKIVVPIFVADEFIGGIGGCGLLLDSDESDIEGFLINMTTGIAEDEIERLSANVGRIKMADAESVSKFIFKEVNRVINSRAGN